MDLPGTCTKNGQNKHVNIALTWTPEGKRKRGRPKETWRRTIEGEQNELGFKTWTEATDAAQDRPNGEDLFTAVISTGREGNKSCSHVTKISQK